MNPIKLKPCPFCGGKAETRLCVGGSWYIVKCTECKATTDVLRGEDEATSAWNKRTDPVVSEWIPFPYNRKRGLCKNCSEWSDSTPKYCPNCDAYMINGVESNAHD